MAKKSDDKMIEDTGERMIPAYHKGQLVYGEHIVRYEGALPLLKGKTVLDIASGSGYGTNLIGSVAKKVYGVDLDDGAVKYAQVNFGRPNTTFLQGSGTAIPLDDNTVDVLVSFETLEHIDDYRAFMREIKRVLKDNGLLILSTPNDKEFPEGAHFHIHEFEEEELNKLVKETFANRKEYFQATWIYNALIDRQQLTTETEFTIATKNVAPVETKKALYFYLLCSNRKITEVVTPIAAISEHWSTRKMLEHNAEMDAYIKKTIKHYDVMVAAKDEQIASLHADFTKANEELTAIKSSRPWKVAKKLGHRKNKLLGK